MLSVVTLHSMRSASLVLGLFGLFVGALSLAACGDDLPPPPPADSGTRDGSLTDSSTPGDSSTMDSGAGSDTGSPMDSGMAGDSSLPGCGPGTVIELFQDTASGSITVNLAGGGNRFLAVWTSLAGGRLNMSSQQFTSDGTSTAVVAVTDDDAITRDPTATWIGDAWMVAWTESVGGANSAFEIWTRVLEPDGSPRAAAVRVTDDALQDFSPAIQHGSTTTSLIWIQRSDAGVQTVIGLAVDGAGAPVGSPALIQGGSDAPIRAFLGPRDTGSIAGWTQAGDPGNDLRTRPVLDSGGAANLPITMSTSSNVFGTVDFTYGLDRGAALFDVRDGATNSIAFRSFDSNGAPIGVERIVTTADLMGQSPSIAAFSGGYAALWRASATARRHMRLVLIDVDGVVVSETQIAALGTVPGQSFIRASADGELFALWTDQDGAATSIQASFLVCGTE